MRTWRGACVGDTPDVIQHQTAGPLEKPALCFVMGEIENTRDAEACVLDDLLDHFGPALASTALGLHRIQHQRTVRMKAHPIVGKHRIRLRRVGGILHGTDGDALTLESPSEALELRARLLTRARTGTRPFSRPLPLVGQSGSWVVVEG